MKKIILWIGGVAVVVLLAVYLVGIFFLGSIVKTGVNRFAPELTRTSVHLDEADISPLSGSGTLTGLTVGNPKGWSEANAFSFSKIHVSVAPGSVFGSPIVVNEVVIEKPEILYETKIISSNLGDLLKNLENATGGGSHPADSTEASAAGKPARFEVKHFTMQGGVVHIGVGAKAVAVPLPPITLDNLGVAEGGITADQLAFAVLRSLTTDVAGSAAHAATQLSGTLGAGAASEAKNGWNSLKGMFGGNK
ncbi:MAG TPA: hypothetical protein VHV47_04650 [Opitutaceae bacterium]|jgi:uncharacterized protein involved in outer membrane biogenesis|nr:hypothetical protein [Opitutaceae bacterium]